MYPSISAGRALVLSAAAAAAVILEPATAGARPPRVSQIPNGSVGNCATCHASASGGGLNPFGQMILTGFMTADNFTGSVVWGPEPAALDADGDGASNGEELGDPAGAWRPGSPNPGDPAAVTHPGDPASFPPPTAVAASTWAQVKRAIQPHD